MVDMQGRVLLPRTAICCSSDGNYTARHLTEQDLSNVLYCRSHCQIFLSVWFHSKEDLTVWTVCDTCDQCVIHVISVWYMWSLCDTSVITYWSHVSHMRSVCDTCDQFVIHIWFLVMCDAGFLMTDLDDILVQPDFPTLVKPPSGLNAEVEGSNRCQYGVIYIGIHLNWELSATLPNCSIQISN